MASFSVLASALIWMVMGMCGALAEAVAVAGGWYGYGSESTIPAIRVLDLSSLPNEMANCDCTPYSEFGLFVYVAPEIQTDIVLDAASLPAAELEGTYELTPAVATALNAVVLETLPFISPEDSAVTTLDNPVAVYFNGTSYEAGTLRLPTVWEPTRSGRVFEYPEDDFYAMNIRNVTLLDGTVAFTNLAESTLFDYVKLTTAPGDPIDNVICFSNSIFVLKSCEGYPTDEVIVALCCAKTDDCILRTQQDLADEGFEVPDDLDPLKCYSMQEE